MADTESLEKEQTSQGRSKDLYCTRWLSAQRMHDGRWCDDVIGWCAVVVSGLDDDDRVGGRCQAATASAKIICEVRWMVWSARYFCFTSSSSWRWQKAENVWPDPLLVWKTDNSSVTGRRLQVTTPEAAESRAEETEWKEAKRAKENVRERIGAGAMKSPSCLRSRRGWWSSWGAQDCQEWHSEETLRR